MPISVASAGVRIIFHAQTQTPGGAAMRDLDLSFYGLRELIFKAPDGSETTKPGTLLHPPGTDGRLFYETTPGFFTAPGRWRVRARIKADFHDCFSPWSDL